MLEMFVDRVGINATDGHPIVLLQDKEQAHSLPIWIGTSEARAIMFAKNKVKPERPQTHDLLVSILTTFGYCMSRLEITKVSDEAFYAKLYLKNGDSEIAIDCRPSDGIALALRVDAPILVARSVMIDVSERQEAEKQKDMDEFRKFLEEVSPADFGKSLESKGHRSSDRPKSKRDRESRKPGNEPHDKGESDKHEPFRDES